MAAAEGRNKNKVKISTFTSWEKERVLGYKIVGSDIAKDSGRVLLIDRRK